MFLKVYAELLLRLIPWLAENFLLAGAGMDVGSGPIQAPNSRHYANFSRVIGFSCLVPIACDLLHSGWQTIKTDGLTLITLERRPKSC